jgi:hypothetical protein
MLPDSEAIPRNPENPRSGIRRLGRCPSIFLRFRIPLLLLQIGLVGLVGGCTSTNASLQSIFSGGCLDEAIEAHRNKTCALKAWFRREHNFCDEPYLRDFRDGFVAGYIAIAEGKPGCPPNVPPKNYWSWAYQSADGQARMAAWYRGYPYGVQAARDDGVSGWNHVQLGPEFQTKAASPTTASASSPAGSPSAAPELNVNGQDLSNPFIAPEASILPQSDASLPGADTIFPGSE